MSFVGKLLSVDQLLMAAAAAHPEAPPALPVIEACRPPVEVIRVRHDDRLVRSALAQVAIENSRRYGGTSCGWFTQLRVRPGETFLVAVAGERAVAGGEYRRIDDNTAEITRIWTSGPQRRKGFGGRILAALEAEAADHGHRSVLLSTGPNQSDLHALCVHGGYRRVGHTEPSGSDAAAVVWGKDLMVVRAPFAVSA